MQNYNTDDQYNKNPEKEEISSIWKDGRKRGNNIPGQAGGQGVEEEALIKI